MIPKEKIAPCRACGSGEYHVLGSIFCVANLTENGTALAERIARLETERDDLIALLRDAQQFVAPNGENTWARRVLIERLAAFLASAPEDHRSKREG